MNHSAFFTETDTNMDKLSTSQIDSLIDNVVAKLNPNSGIKEVYPSQRSLLHEFCRGNNIIYTGILNVS